MTLVTTEWPGERDNVAALTAAAVERKCKAGMFKAFPAWDRKALADHCFEFAVEAAQTCDRAKSSVSTWVSFVVGRRLQDLHRTLTRERARERKAAVDRDYLAQGRAFEDVDDSLPLSEWAGEIYRQAVHTAGRQLTGRGPRYLEAAQAATLLAIKRRMKLSNRGVIALLEDRPEIVRSIRLKRLPSYRKMHRLCDSYRGRAANNGGQNRRRMAKGTSEWVGEAEAAAIVGLASSTLKAWRLNQQSPFRIFKPGGRVRYDRKQLAEYIKANTTEPAIATS